MYMNTGVYLFIQRMNHTPVNFCMANSLLVREIWSDWYWEAWK